MSKLNRKISEIIGVNTPPLARNVRGFRCPSNIGIEIEVENWSGEGIFNLDKWSLIHDGSLRNNGVELVSSVVSGNKALRAIRDVSEFIGKYQKQADFSKRTSTHVHVDITDLSLHEFKNLVYLNMGLETMLMKLVSPHRRVNNFCLTTDKTYKVIVMLRDLFRDCDDDMEYVFRNIGAELRPSRFKYAAINYCNICSLGTVEYRMHQGTSDYKELKRWVALLTSIKELAKSTVNISEIRADKVSGSLANHFRSLLDSLGFEAPSECELNRMFDSSFELSNDLLFTDVLNSLVDSKVERADVQDARRHTHVSPFPIEPIAQDMEQSRHELDRLRQLTTDAGSMEEILNMWYRHRESGVTDGNIRGASWSVIAPDDIDL